MIYDKFRKDSIMNENVNIDIPRKQGKALFKISWSSKYEKQKEDFYPRELCEYMIENKKILVCDNHKNSWYVDIDKSDNVSHARKLENNELRIRILQGDYFVLCENTIKRKHNYVRGFGKVVGNDWQVLNEEVKEKFNLPENLHYYTIDVEFEDIAEEGLEDKRKNSEKELSDIGKSGSNYAWLPKAGSLISNVPEEHYGLFDKIVFQPYFGYSVKEKGFDYEEADIEKYGKTTSEEGLDNLRVKLNEQYSEIEFLRLGFEDDEMMKAGIAAIGWTEVGDLENYLDENGKIDIEKLQPIVWEKSYENDSKKKGKATTKAKELKRFYEANPQKNVFVVMHDKMILGFIDGFGENMFDKTRASHAHCRQAGTWKEYLGISGDKTIKGKYAVLTSCSPITDPISIVQLYKGYYLDDNAAYLVGDDGKVVDSQIGYKSNDKKDDLKMAVDKAFQSGFVNIGYPYNRIIFGAPGTGKSYLLDKETNGLLGLDTDENGELNDRQIKYLEEHCERVTLYSDYSYAKFFGTYKPKPTNNGKDVTYEFVPGPLVRMLEKAYRNIDECKSGLAKPEAFLLIIEEINRADVAAVFGDVFQLLDRSNGEGISDYFITASEDVKAYFRQKGIAKNTLRLPDNLFIWATMNSADQGVFPIDTAFKRRWVFEYMDINDGQGNCNFPIEFQNDETGKNHRFNWNDFRMEVNSKMLDQGINEDKLMGPFFISKKEFEGKTNDRKFELFASKVLMYLYEDASKQYRTEVFSGASDDELKSYSRLRKAFKQKGIEIFGTPIGNDQSNE